jgi:hypothetical protein
LSTVKGQLSPNQEAEQLNLTLFAGAKVRFEVLVVCKNVETQDLRIIFRQLLVLFLK